MGEWERCKKFVKEELGEGGATPAQLRRAVADYADIRSARLTIKYLSKNVRWSWLRLESIGRQISLRASRTNPNDIDAGIGNALIALSRHYLSATRLRRESNKWDNLQHCALCWRLVPHSSRPTHRALCSHHQPRTAEYQRHNRKAETAKEIYIKSHKVPPSHPLRKPDNLVTGLSIWLKKYYPHTFKYLSDGKADTSDWLNVIRYLDDTRDRNNARAKIHLIMANEPEQVLSMIGWSEAWLAALKKERRGGKRKGAGRPKKQ